MGKNLTAMILVIASILLSCSGLYFTLMTGLGIKDIPLIILVVSVFVAFAVLVSSYVVDNVEL